MAAKKNGASVAQKGGSPKQARKAKKLSLEQRLIKALNHPLRVEILDLLNVDEWSPRGLERELGEGLSQVSYHVKVLKDFELIEMTKTEPRRGAVEHFYRAVERAFVPAGMSKGMPKSAQKIIGNGIVGKIDRDVAASLASGKFYAREDWHTSWTPVDLDDEARAEAEKLADRFVEDLLELGAESANRRAAGKGSGEHIWTTAAVLLFGSELGEKENTPPKKRRGKKSKGR